MSFQLKTPQPQTKLAFVSGDHISHDGVLVSRLIPITLDLFDTKQSPPRLEFLHNFSKRKQQKRSLEDHNCEETMDKKNGNNNIPSLDLKLNLSPPSSEVTEELSAGQSPSISPTSSCVSSEMSSPLSTNMVLVGCPRCLMYVMLSQDDPKCPKCKSTVLLDFLHENKGNDNGDDNCGNNGISKKIKKS